MTGPAQQTAREQYLASLSSAEELSTRRAAEISGVPSDDPMWLLMLEVRRACNDMNESISLLRQAASDAAQRIERAASSDGKPPALEDSHITHIASTAGASVAKNPQVTLAVASAIRQIESDASRALRCAETSIRELTRRRSATPFASLMFAFALGVTSCCAAVWGGYHIGFAYGQDLGYRAGFHYARIYDRSHQ
jgi:hypothetical protein